MTLIGTQNLIDNQLGITINVKMFKFKFNGCFKTEEQGFILSIIIITRKVKFERIRDGDTLRGEENYFGSPTLFTSRTIKVYSNIKIFLSVYMLLYLINLENASSRRVVWRVVLNSIGASANWSAITWPLIDFLLTTLISHSYNNINQFFIVLDICYFDMRYFNRLTRLEMYVVHKI